MTSFGAPRTYTSAARGFSILELLVVVTIFITITTVVLANYNKFRSSTILTNLTYNIALAVREAQVYGLSFRATEDITPFGSYGVHFDATSGANRQFILFADALPAGNPDRRYTSQTEEVQKYTIQSGYLINRLCGYVNVSSSCTALRDLDIVYSRPNPEAYISGRRLSDNSLMTFSYGAVTVSTSDGTATRTVKLWSSGQISVQ